MCYGVDGNAPLQRSPARWGIDRRGFLRDALVGATGLAAAGAECIVENDTPDVTPLHTADVGYEYLRRLRY